MNSDDLETDCRRLLRALARMRHLLPENFHDRFDDGVFYWEIALGQAGTPEGIDRALAIGQKLWTSIRRLPSTADVETVLMAISIVGNRIGSLKELMELERHLASDHHWRRYRGLVSDIDAVMGEGFADHVLDLTRGKTPAPLVS